jgi:hypothetical protein
LEQLKVRYQLNDSYLLDSRLNLTLWNLAMSLVCQYS